VKTTILRNTTVILDIAYGLGLFQSGVPEIRSRSIVGGRKGTVSVQLRQLETASLDRWSPVIETSS
jgi:hypothetical protein